MAIEADEQLISGDVIFVFHDTSTNRFLLSERASTNQDLPGECIFPSEKSERHETPRETLTRGVYEEMGDHVIPIEVNELPIKMSHLLHGYPINFRVFIVNSWGGKINNREPNKEKFIWTDRDEVMDRLSVTESKLIFLLILANIGQLKASDFEKAPKIKS